MKPKTYFILSEAIEIGARHGYVRAFKHLDSPEESFILECIHQAIMLEICERFSFDDESND